MKLKIIAIRDTKAEYYLNPLCFKTIGEAERSFAEECNNPQSTMYKNPEDFGMYLLGEYDNAEGKIHHESQPKHLASAISFKKAQSQ